MSTHFYIFLSEWNSWFSSYQNFIFHYAELAETHCAGQFCIGTELSGTSHREADWREVIAGIRNRYYGPITYASNSGDEMNITWWDAVDCIGVDVYYRLTDKNDPTVEKLKAAWIPYVNQFSNLSTLWTKQIIFTEIGFSSADGTNKHPWEYSSEADIDLQEQADCYQATFESIYNQSWLAGFFWWA